MGAGYVGPESAAVPELLSGGLVERNEEIFVSTAVTATSTRRTPTPMPRS